MDAQADEAAVSAYGKVAWLRDAPGRFERATSASAGQRSIP